MLTINVIYIKDTVATLLPFLSSLLEHSQCNYRLVSNACTEQEEVLLQHFAGNDPRVSFYSLKSISVLLHHEVLHLLLSEERSPWFAFMDSDMIATGEFLPCLERSLEQYDAVFTGLPVWHEALEMQMPRGFKIMGGRFVRAHNNYLLGLSYAAIYSTEGVRQFMNQSGIDFRKYYWHEIPEACQETLVKLDLKKHLYDTAKVLNILWQNAGANMIFTDVASLMHLGGVSGPDNRPGFWHKTRQNLSRLIPGLLSTTIKSMLRFDDRITFSERMNIERLVKKRRISAAILRQNLHATEATKGMKEARFLGADMKARIEAAIQEISTLMESFQNKNPEKNA